MLIAIPCVLSSTILSENSVLLLCVSVLVSILVNYMPTLNCRSSPSAKSPKPKIPMITHFRALSNLLTSISILAVDFQIYPRKFAKTENFGYSLMDTGVGFFICSNALVSPEARDEGFKNHGSFSSTFVKNFKACIPLIVLGLGRALAIEYLDYQRHVSEYGVHWNFFVTLAFVKLFCSLVLGRISSRYSFAPGLWLLVMHEYVLSNRGFKEWILGYAPRDNFVSANREGLASLPGYVALYLCCISIGKLIHSAYRNQIYHSKFVPAVKCSSKLVLFVQLFVVFVVAWALTFSFADTFGVSRRLVNFCYVSWIIGLSSFCLWSLMIVDFFVAGRRNSYSLEMIEAINYNGLGFFLVANIMTGVINMSMKTLYVSTTRAVYILVGYTGINVLAVLALYRSRIQLKF